MKLIVNNLEKFLLQYSISLFIYKSSIILYFISFLWVVITRLTGMCYFSIGYIEGFSVDSNLLILLFFLLMIINVKYYLKISEKNIYIMSIFSLCNFILICFIQYFYFPVFDAIF